MISLSDSQLRIIALHLIIFRNHRIQYRLTKSNINPLDLYQMEDRQLFHLGFSMNVIRELKFNYGCVARNEIELCRRNDIEIIFRGDKFYPELLAEIYDPPEYLYVKGDKSALKTKMLGVVGSRAATQYGKNAVNRLIPDLVEAGLTIVSGMAYGIDSMAQQLTINRGGKTIGINAGGLLHLYPAGNKSLTSNICLHGCVISEFPLETVPRPFFFPIRNRLIAGLVPAVLVVEAAMKSGSLVTARLALEQNRDVLAVPGPIDSRLSQGSNELILQGAKLIRCPQDILDEYGIEFESSRIKKLIGLSVKEKRILDLMDSNEVKGIDYFVEKLDFSVSEIISLLMGLVLKKIVIQDAGGYRKAL